MVGAALIDGGRALECAVKHLPGVTRRRCFAHCTRMGFTRRGGKRGGKGSLPRYLLDHGVKPKVTANMISLVLMVLWLPSKLEYEQAMTLFVNEFKDDINEHMAQTYLDPKHPENLGGRAAGHKATSSSTNGVERRGGIYKTKAKGITATLPMSEKNNFVYVMEGMLSSRYKLPTGSLENCHWLEMPRTTTDIHDQKNVFDGHENASETRKVEAKLASCLLQTEGQTNWYGCGANQGRNSSAPGSAPAVYSAHSGGLLCTSSVWHPPLLCTF